MLDLTATLLAPPFEWWWSDEYMEKTQSCHNVCAAQQYYLFTFRFFDPSRKARDSSRWSVLGLKHFHRDKPSLLLSC